MNGVKECGYALDKPATRVSYNSALGYLRAFLVVLVLAHHAVLAYHSFAPKPASSLTAEPRWWPAFPVVDTQRWNGFTLLVGFNDVFFMSLLFFLSGLFVWSSIQRKGIRSFLHDRLIRLGLPFVFAAAFLAPLAYFPAYLQTNAEPGLAGFAKQWFALGIWPAGPVWFVWVLLVFDGIAALMFTLTPAVIDASSRFMSCLSRRPIVLFTWMVVASAAAYLPMALVFNPMHWSALGPFTFQTSRIFHYFIYFAFGIALGAAGIDSGLLSRDGKLARRWPAWMFAALLGFVVATGVTIAILTSHIGSQKWAAAGAFCFVFSCAASSFAFLSLFLRFARSRVQLFDSLRDNSYGIYLFHYPFVSWLQYSLLSTPLPAVAKASLVIAGALLLSWTTSALLRRLPAVARVI